jgi:hypothetical protein
MKKKEYTRTWSMKQSSQRARAYRVSRVVPKFTLDWLMERFLQRYDQDEAGKVCQAFYEKYALQDWEGILDGKNGKLTEDNIDSFISQWCDNYDQKKIRNKDSQSIFNNFIETIESSRVNYEDINQITLLHLINLIQNSVDKREIEKLSLAISDPDDYKAKLAKEINERYNKR